MGSVPAFAHVTDNDGHLGIDVPTYRVDVTRPCDIIEDVLRIYGYNNIAMSDELHACLSFKTAVDAADDFRRRGISRPMSRAKSENSISTWAGFTATGYMSTGWPQILPPAVSFMIIAASLLHACLSFKTAVDAADDFRRLLAEQLCGAGYSEILNNSLTCSVPAFALYTLPNS